MNLMKIYMMSPMRIKRIFANAEALRRQYNRRGGQYKKFYDEMRLSILYGFSEERQTEKLNHVVKYVNQNIEYYKKNQLPLLDNTKDIKKLPRMSKKIMCENIEQFININKKYDLVKGKTSGSTGTPFTFFTDKKAMRFNYAVYDHMYNSFAEGFRTSKVRISGVKISNSGSKPPFWYYIDFIKQLQCSTYHINKKSFKQYLEAFDKYKVKWGSGYASSWFFLAELMSETNIKYHGLSAIFLDSEGIEDEQRHLIEQQFHCNVYQTYGLSEVAMVAIQCECGHYHFFSESCLVEILGEDGNNVQKGEAGEIVVTNLNAYDAPMIRYRTGDLGILGQKPCNCGWKTPYIKSLEGRVEDYILAQNGTKVRKLDHVAKEAVGIAGMQIIQKSREETEVLIVAKENFEPESMELVVNSLKFYLGENVDINWKKTNSLEKTKNGKIRFIIRR